MPRVLYDQYLAEIQRDMLLLGSMAERAVTLAMEALAKRDIELAQRVVYDDVAVNQKRYEIEDRCIELIATQQPAAGDLRMLASVLYIIVDLERIGDHAEGIARLVGQLSGASAPPPPELHEMAEIANAMLAESLAAFRQQDTSLARAICDRDDEVDRRQDRISYAMAAEMARDASSTDALLRYTWVAHNLERIADRATNICERVVYLVEGRIEELNVSKY